MKPFDFNYDELGDTLYISFFPGEKGTGIELNDHILLRIDLKKKRPLGLTFFEYSVLAQQTDMGSRSFPLSGLADLSSARRELVLNIIKTPPVNQILRVSAYSPSILETIPITTLEPLAVPNAISP
jgi:uncharacterized protein YuzE